MRYARCDLGGFATCVVSSRCWWRSYVITRIWCRLRRLWRCERSRKCTPVEVMLPLCTIPQRQNDNQGTHMPVCECQHLCLIGAIRVRFIGERNVEVFTQKG